MRIAFDNFRIRNKLFFAYSGTFTLVFLLTGLIVFSKVKDIVRENIENELHRATQTIQTMIRTTADVSIKNYMRAVAEDALEEAEYFHRQATLGQMTDQEARALTKRMLLSKTIGETGRIYCLDSNGIMLINHRHSLEDVDMSNLPFVREQVRRKAGYLEYEWKEPLGTSPRAKAVYMTYFEPWDWIITASAFRSEFAQLVNVNDFRRRLFEFSSGESGYPFVVGYDGTMLIHPFLAGMHYNDYDDRNMATIVQRIVEEKNGHFDYDWSNPGENQIRRKVVYFKDIPELRWVVGSSSYHEEFNAPLDAIGYVIAVALAAALFLMLPISMVIGALITSPLKGFRTSFAKAAQGDFNVRMPSLSRDELGLMAAYFNSFMEQLERYSNDLKNEIAVRKETEKQLIAMDKTKSMFLASASHELRTPLTSIIGFLKLMEKNFTTHFLPHLTESEEAERANQFGKNLYIVRAESDRLGRLVNDLLDLSKIEAGKMEWRDESLSVQDILERAADAVKAYSAKTPEISLTVQEPEGPLTVLCDCDRLHQVLINLLSNAFKNTDSGMVTLTAQPHDDGAKFSVCDTGRGIPEKDLEKIFDIFYQVHDVDEHSSKVFGTGLGLSICRQIINHYGGELEVESEIGSGSCFTFIIPGE